MKLLKIAVTLLMLCGVISLSLSCSKSSSTATVKTQTATVQKGSLSVTVTGTGNLAFSHTEDLAFHIPSTFSKTTPLTVAEVLVEAGDSG